MGADSERIIRALTKAGVSGADQFGTFVSNTRYFAPSRFDERAAMPVLLTLLPSIEDSRDLAAAVGHLRRPWARPIAFQPLLKAFQARAAENRLLGWSIGDALATSSTVEHLDSLLDIANDQKYGRARQMIVHSLWRFKKDPRVARILRSLISDPDVSLHAMSALRRTIGNEAAIRELIVVRNGSTDQGIRKQAQMAIAKSEAALAKSSRGQQHRGLGSRDK